MKTLLKLSLLTTLLCSTAFAAPAKKVAVIVPAEIAALNEITQGFENTLKAQYPQAIEIKMAHTQGDVNLQHATIQALKSQGYDVIAPIGSDATAMTVSMVKDIPIVSLASDMSEAQRQALKPCHVAIVHDEISPEQQLVFIHQALPQLKHIVLIHSASDKIFPEVKQAQQAATQLGLSLTPLLANSLMDLQTVAKNLPPNTQAIFVLKDMNIVSGISQLAMIAQNKHIPLIASDDGSVQHGADVAVGVHEKEIGAAGAVLTAAILQGKDACHLPITEMRHLTVFVNTKALSAHDISLASLKNTAQQQHYAVEMVA